MPNCKMTTTKKILTFILIGLSSIACGQTDTTRKKFEYEICVYHRPNEKPTILRNEKKGVADTIVAFISGTILDYNEKPIAYVVLNLTSIKDSSKQGTLTDSLGNFTLHLPSDKYKLTALCVGYSSLTINEFQLGTGELRELKLRLGSAGGFTTYLIESDKPLNERKLNKIERRLRRKK